MGNMDIYKKHNKYIKIVQIKSQLTLQQHRVFDALMFILQHSKKYDVAHIKDKKMEFSLTDFKHYLTMNSKTKRINRDELKDAVDALTSIKLVFDVKDDEIDKVEFNNVFQSAHIDFKEDIIKFRFSVDFSSEYMIPDAKQGNYTLLSSVYINRLKKTYSRLLYQHFKMLIGKNGFRDNIKMTPDGLRNMLGLVEKTYQVNSQITNKIIKPSIKEINAETDIEITKMEIFKKGRHIDYYYFEFCNKDEIDKPKKVQPSLMPEDEIFNPEIFEAEVISQEGDEITTENPKQGYMDIVPKKEFKDSEEFRTYMIERHTGKILPKMFLPNGNEVQLRINETGRLEYAKNKTILTTPLAKLAWETIFFCRDNILENEESLQERADVLRDGDGNNINIFDLYESEGK